MELCQCFNRTAVGCNRFSRRMVWLLGQGMADCFAPAFGGPQIIRSFGHPLAFNAPSQRAAHHRTLANPAQPCQLAVKFLLSRRRRPQQLGQSGGHRPKYCPLKACRANSISVYKQIYVYHRSALWPLSLATQRTRRLAAPSAPPPSAKRRRRSF